MIEHTESKIENASIRFERWTARVTGIVQGVGFRPFVFRLATELHLSGWVRNDRGGVALEVEGMTHLLDEFFHRLEREAPFPTRVDAVVFTNKRVEQQCEREMLIIESDADCQPLDRAIIPPDIATCDLCTTEVFDAKDRRYGYPFTNCTHCGPRFTIITSIPYDRPRTTMRGFPLCPDCATEYSAPDDRRFHAQPVACPTCGPKLWFERTDGRRHDSSRALEEAAAYVRKGKILAVKGLGGFHLACLAESDETVARLRRLKHRPQQALALMVPDIVTARTFAYLSDDEVRWLLSPEAPIVLARKRRDDFPAIAPDNASIGLMLPYTPLHHLLLRAVGKPLVMTSGNRSGEPLCRENDDARARLSGLCDAFLMHDRPIERRCDDSVLFVSNSDGESMTQYVRRSRGFTPLPVHLPRGLSSRIPLLAAGADMKNVAALCKDSDVFLTQHIGTLDNPDAVEEHRCAISSMQELLDIHPKAIVCDMHPGYACANEARERASAENLPLFEVQHHHAHVAGCMAENDCMTPVIGFSFDGTGYGTDGNIWGGEVLLSEFHAFERIMHLQYLPLPGGEAAIRKPYRLAVAALHELRIEADVHALFPFIGNEEISTLIHMVDERLNTPRTSSMGRLFDVVSALLGLCTHSSYEAQAAIALEAQAMRNDTRSSYPISIEGGVIPVGELLSSVLEDRLKGEGIPHIAMKFHNTIAASVSSIACTVRNQFHLSTVALSGGVWQNRLLLERTLRLLRQEGFDVLLHRNVPANDGGIAYGQAVVASARMAREGIR